MFPRPPLPRRVCLILFCLGPILAFGAEAPYTEDFNSYADGSVPANFVETPDSNWFAGSGSYYGNVAVSGGEAAAASGLPLTNVSGRNFTVKISFAATTNGGIDVRLANLGLVALGADPNLTQGGYRLVYYVSGLFDVFGKLLLERAGAGGPIASLSLSGLDYFGSPHNPPSANPHRTMTLEGVYGDGTLFLTGRISDGVRTISVQITDPNPLTGPYFGLRQWTKATAPKVAGLNAWYDDFSVTVEPRPARLGNVAARLNVGTGNDVAIAGFIVTGNTPKRVLLRGTSSPPLPSLPDPILELHGPGRSPITNDNWQDFQQSEIEATGLAPAQTNASAIIALLEPGAYTAVLRGKNATTGSGLLELYDLSATASSKVGNISARGRVGIGDNVIIAGVIATGDTQARVIVRSLGPTLADFGISGFLADPTIELRDQNGGVVQTNDNWRDSQESDLLATSLAPPHDPEAAIAADLLPANYTAVVRGKNGATGIALVELYHLN